MLRRSVPPPYGMKWPLGAPGTVSRRGEICVKGEAEENNSAVLAERAPTLSIGTLGAATLDGPPYSWSFIKQDQGELYSHAAIVSISLIINDGRNFS